MELLAPAGDINILKKAFTAGADAVYMGGDAFGARVSAAFSREDAARAIEYAHERNKRIYLTVNTLLKNPEMERELYDFLDYYDRLFVDGIIVQDIGVFSFCRKFFPNLPLHASTQMNISSKYGAAFAASMGASRIVPARELSIAEIAAIHRALPELEIEAFLHGALCVCYSGQCLMSSVIGGRSGNRGACAQPCRKKYEAYDEGGNLLGDFGYYLSPKDLCGIHALPRMREAGVYSYKIEGRLKNEAYVAGVVSVYRKYFDILEDGGDYQVDESDVKRLLSYGTRGGGTDAYFDLRNDTSMIDPSSSAFRQECSRVELSESKRRVTAILNVVPGEPLSMNVTYGTLTVSVEGEPVEEAKNRATTTDEIRDKLSKTGEEAFDFSDIRVELEGEPFVPMKHLKELRRRAFTHLSAMLRREYSVRNRLDYEPPSLPTLHGNKEADLLVEVRTAEQLAAAMDFEAVRGIALPAGLLGEMPRDTDKSFYFRLPTVIRDGDADGIKGLIKKYSKVLSGVVADSCDALGLLDETGFDRSDIIFGDRLYAYSDRSEAAFFERGYKWLHVPIELNEKELSHRYNGTGVMDIYGRTPLMYMVNCPAKRFYGCKKRPKAVIELRDERGGVFPVVNDCDYCTNTLYNGLPLSLLSDSDRVGRLAPARHKITFVFEDGDEVRRVLSVYEKNYILGQDESIDIPATRLHFKRGLS